MTTIPNSVSKAAHLGSTLAMAAVTLVVVGVSAAALQILPALGGFLLMVLGLGLALVATVTSIVGLVATSPSKHREGRAAAVRGLLLGIATVVAVAIPASKGGGVPRINDITTDLVDPPVFVVAAEAEANKGRDMSYPGSSFAEQQQAAYSDLAALVIEDTPDQAYDRVHLVLAGMPRIQITGESREEGRIEATETSALFHFSDDVVVRILPFQDGGSRIDVRSKSRDGKGDLGVNAARIREIFTLVRATAPPAASAPAVPSAPVAETAPAADAH